MGQILSEELFARLAPLAEAFAAQALIEARSIVQIDDGADEESIAGAAAVNAATVAFNALLRAIPLSDMGIMVAIGAVYGTALGSTDGDRRELHDIFQRQGAATLAEMAAMRMPAQGTA